MRAKKQLLLALPPLAIHQSGVKETREGRVLKVDDDYCSRGMKRFGLRRQKCMGTRNARVFVVV
jgi:hypothetical protein